MIIYVDTIEEPKEHYWYMMLQRKKHLKVLKDGCQSSKPKQTLIL